MEADKIKDSIKRAAQDLFRKFGYHKTSVNEIAKKAKIAKATIYKYFESKEDVLHSLLMDYIKVIVHDLIHANTPEMDEEAQRLSTSVLQRHLKLIRGEPIMVPAPVESMEGLWSEAERFLVESRLSVAVIGGPETIRQKLAQLLRETKADELIFTSDLYDHALRLKSFEIAANAIKTLTVTV